MSETRRTAGADAPREAAPKLPPPPRSFAAAEGSVAKRHYLIDAEGLILGRLAAYVAKLLIGKHKADYTPHVDCGDNVVVVNAGKVALSGNKLRDKLYYRHSGYPGGIRSVSASRILQGETPQNLIINAVKGMLKNNPMGRRRLKNLRVYPGAERLSQKELSPLDLAAENRKNKK